MMTIYLGDPDSHSPVGSIPLQAGRWPQPRARVIPKCMSIKAKNNHIDSQSHTFIVRNMEFVPPYIPDDIKLASQFRDAQPRNHTLPFEVLGLIFHYIPKLGPIDLQPILFVCKSWHEAVCHHSSLWSDIKLNYTIYTTFSVDGAFQESRASNYLCCCLKYSGTMPLDITLDFEHRIEVELHIKIQLILLLKVLVGRDEEHLVRWRSFKWHAKWEESIPITLCFLPSTIPNLQTVKFFNINYKDELHTAFPTCPNLQLVEIHHYNQLILREIDCSHVAELKFGSDTIWRPKDVEVLDRFSNVRRLTLYTVGHPLFARRPNDLKTEVLFPYLHSLRLYGQLVWEIVKVLKTPKLKELEFDEVSSFDLLKRVSLASTIDTVHVQIRRDNIDSVVGVYEKIVELPAVAPLLQRLRIPKWLHEGLESGSRCLEERRVHLEVVTE